MRRTPESNLLIADFQNKHHHYANAVRVGECIVTAHHVAGTNPALFSGNKRIKYSDFKQYLGRDLAATSYADTQQGFSFVHEAKDGEQVIVTGFHGEKRHKFEIPGIVIGLDLKGRVIIESSRDDTHFQLGMSGSACIFDADTIVGFLVAEVDGYKGKRAYFEPAWVLLPYIAGIRLDNDIISVCH